MPTYASGEYAAQLLRLSQLVVNVLTKPQETGRQDLGDLISTAASFRARGEREDDTIMKASAELAYKATSFTFRRYQDETFRRASEEIGFVDMEAARKASMYIFCEHRIREFDSLESLEAAAQQDVEKKVETLIAMAQSISRNRGR